MNTRDLLNIFTFVQDHPEITRHFDLILQDGDSTKVGDAIAYLIRLYSQNHYHGQKVTDQTEMVEDQKFRPCFETAISENASELITAWRISPAELAKTFDGLMADEALAQKEDWERHLEAE